MSQSTMRPCAVRETLRDAHGNTLHVQDSNSETAPCRSCLRITPHGSPHADACEPYATRAVFTPEFRPRRLVFRAYDAAGSIHAATLAGGGEAEATLNRLFADPSVRVVHVRNPAWGCFDFAVERG